MRTIWRPLLALNLVALLFILTGCDAKARPDPPPSRAPEESPLSPASSTPPPATTATPPASAMKPLPGDVWRGVCFAHNWQGGGKRGYGTAASAEALDHLVSLGVNRVSITPFGWMDSVHAPVIGGEYDRVMPGAGETRDRVERVIAQAHERGVAVMLKPHIWIRGGAWRGKIDPRDGDTPAWGAWWESYREFIRYYATLAAKNEVESLVVGVELVSAVKNHPDEFLKTIAMAREIYDGHITYSANWDEEVEDEVWLALDSIGVQFYPPLSDRENPSVEELDAALKKHLKMWTDLSARINRPVMLTETGYKSAPTAVKEPFGWPENLPAHERVSDEDLQALAYHALLTRVGKTPAIKGVFIWKYFTDEATDEEGVYGFTPHGKKAEAVLDAAF